ncbi:ras GTPase-activating-like protein IQGAP1 isoform X2 [Amphiura filiformis]|uniref:ras GTPase-activating-like protein IQGAP1 isoform X2 n=1 Tax=Amphiura filiformis TaxID=82378 RepID=UPI003B21FD10
MADTAVNGNGVDHGEEEVDGRVSAVYDSDNEDMPHRISADQMDEERKKNVAYQYLCHLEETKKWIEACIEEELPEAVDLEENLQNGVLLGKLAHFYCPEKVPLKRIYDKDQSRYKSKGLHFRHTDNIMQWFRSMESIGLPKIFYPETTDVYDRKNMPRAVYCLHALSLYLFKLGIAPQIESLYGKAEFTEEQISNMQQELDKYGIQMPSFGKIGGILAEEMSVDEAAMHAAVIKINDAIDKNESGEILAALQNPNAVLIHVNLKNKDQYQTTLQDAKKSKADDAFNRSLREGDDSQRDVYELLLTQAEIQGNVNSVNVKTLLRTVNGAVDSDDEKILLNALMDPALSCKGVNSASGSYYMNNLKEIKEEKGQELEKEDVHAGVGTANAEAKEKSGILNAVATINSAIDGGNAEDTVLALSNKDAKLPAVLRQPVNLYQSELHKFKAANDGDLAHDQLVDAVRVLTAIAQINHILESEDAGATVAALLAPYACINDVDDDETLQQRYHDALVSMKRQRVQEGVDFLTQNDIQANVDKVNAEVMEEQERILAVARINEALDTGDPAETLEALQTPAAKLGDVDAKHAVIYQTVLQTDKEQKAKTTEDEAAVLWLDEIQDGVNKANKTANDANKLAIGMVTINLMIDEDNNSALLGALQSSDVGLNSVTQDCVEGYSTQLRAAKQEKLQSGSPTSWVSHQLKNGMLFYFNLDTMESRWLEPEEFESSNSQLSKPEVQAILTRVTADYDRGLLFKANEDKIVLLQSHTRGVLARKAYQERLDFIKRQLPAIIRIQSWFKGRKQRQAYSDRVNYMKEHEEQAVKIQSYGKMHLARKAYKERLQYFRDNASAVVKLQSFWRSNKARHDYHILTHEENPPVVVVSKFVHLLEQGEQDLKEELELQGLRGRVVKQIRTNQQLENDLNLMDIKIGLLVKNRITLQDVVAGAGQGRKARRNTGDFSREKGLKALSKEKREMLEAYQHLFYLLQTNPSYLAKLIFAMPQSKTTKFMESVILTLYNYAANQREEYLLLRLFKTALEEEITERPIDGKGLMTSKVDKMLEIVTGNPMVIRMVVTFNRGAKGQSSLRELLQPLVKSVLEDKSLNINTNPVEVYKAWISQTETETGEASKLPYDVTGAQALAHQEVKDKLFECVKCLGEVANRFLTHIVSSVDKIPYGIRYIAKVLKHSLETKFPEASSDDVLKIVGNLIYYRYMNPAIVAPDAFDIVDIGVEKGMSNDQRRNLGSITKVLQSVASGKKFGEDSAHLQQLNPFVEEAFERFKVFYNDVCDVAEPEDAFNIDEYSDFVNPSKPIVYMSVKEIIDTHALLMEHLDALAPDKEDPLHELLDDLGEVPSVEDILGEAPADLSDPQAEQVIASMAKTEISLTLNNKFEIHEDGDEDTKKLFLKVKRLLVDVIGCQSGDSVEHILTTPATTDQEEAHRLLVQKRMKQDESLKHDSTKLTRNASGLDDNKLPIEAKKQKILKSLRKLEEAGRVSKEDDYQDLINSIAQDIRNQRRYRQRRKQDLLRMRGTLEGLENKATFYEEQNDYYNQYIRTCLDNLQAKKVFKTDEKKKGKHKASNLKYTGAKLYEKGIILEIEGLEEPQYKNVMFEITQTSDPGVFDVNAKFMGVKMDSIQLVFQDLLQLQYEGAQVMNMFNRAKINVNLLIFMVNKKFYGK